MSTLHSNLCFGKIFFFDCLSHLNAQLLKIWKTEISSISCVKCQARIKLSNSFYTGLIVFVIVCITKSCLHLCIKRGKLWRFKMITSCPDHWINLHVKVPVPSKDYNQCLHNVVCWQHSQYPHCNFDIWYTIIDWVCLGNSKVKHCGAFFIMPVYVWISGAHIYYHVAVLPYFRYELVKSEAIPQFVDPAYEKSVCLNSSMGQPE